MDAVDEPLALITSATSDIGLAKLAAAGAEERGAELAPGNKGLTLYREELAVRNRQRRRLLPLLEVVGQAHGEALSD